MKRFNSLFFICLTSLFVFGTNEQGNECSNSSSQDIRQYFFPLGECADIYKPDETESVKNGLIYYSFVPAVTGRILKEERKILFNDFLTITKLTKYFVEGNVVLSTQHKTLNLNKGDYETYDDLIKLFVFPISETKPYEWDETYEGHGFICKSEYVYVKFSNDDCAQTVKITKEGAIITDEGIKRYKEWSYWEPGRGRIANFYSIDGQPAVLERMLNLSVSFYGMQEIDKDEYLRLYQIMKDKPYQKFISGLETIDYSYLIDGKAHAYLMEFIGKLMQKEDSTKGEFVATYVNIDVDHQGIVSISGENLKTQLVPIIADTVMSMLKDGRIEQPIIKDRKTGMSAKQPILIKVLAYFHRSKFTTTMIHKKDHWEYDKATYPASEFKGIVTDIANNFLVENPKVKVVTIQIDYFLVGENKVVVLSNNIQQVK